VVGGISGVCCSFELSLSQLIDPFLEMDRHEGVTFPRFFSDPEIMLLLFFFEGRLSQEHFLWGSTPCEVFLTVKLALTPLGFFRNLPLS